ncbi:MAG: hypothetical protein M3068_13130 [Gemmatimonadota bacterium]|nr:hypothetical protein [Gemmatimonadota bacterium]
MRLEQLPLLFGILAILAGLAIFTDAVVQDGRFVARERRSRERPERNRAGEALLAVGVVLAGAVFLGRDSWRFSTLAVVIATLFVIAGIALNWRYIRGLMFGPGLGKTLRRRATDVAPPVDDAKATPSDHMRIR